MRTTRLFVVFDLQNPGVIYYLAAGSDCRLRLPAMSCDRHPDQAIYLSPPPDDGPKLWTRWAPDLVVEIVSEGGEERDYVEKREEYLRCGVREYWILNPATRVLHALQRAGDVWEEVTVAADASYRLPAPARLGSPPGRPVRPGRGRIDSRSPACLTPRDGLGYDAPLPEMVLSEISTPMADPITYDDFAKLELRVAKVLDARPAPPTPTSSFCSKSTSATSRSRSWRASAPTTRPSRSSARNIVIVNNLAPAMLRGETSNGMLLAATSGDKGDPARPRGCRVRRRGQDQVDPAEA